MSQHVTKGLRRALFTGQKVFLPSQHVWLQVSKLTPGDGCGAISSINVQFGLTDRGLEDIGDVTSIRGATGSPINEGEAILKLEWEGYQRTECDELYHAVWETIEGETVLASPVTGVLTKIVADPAKEEVDADTILGEVQCSQDSIEQAIGNNGLDEFQYTTYTRSMNRGMFSEI